jgi:hypothetical protein
MIPKPKFEHAFRADGEVVRESRELDPFDRLLMKDHGELLIVQGERPALVVEADQALQRRLKSEVQNGRLTLGFGSWLDKLGEAFTTSLTRKAIRYTLTVTELTEIEICGLARVRAESLVSEWLHLKLCGPVDAYFASLKAAALEVDVPTGGRLTIAGRVTTQEISIHGPGEYDGALLLSDRARVRVFGPGQATVWATEELDVQIRGIGDVAYRGTPTIKKQIMGIGRLRHLHRTMQS